MGRVPQSSQDNKQKPQTKVPSFEMPLLANNPKPRIILGTMTFGPDTSTGARITSLDEYNTFLDHFQAAGYGEIDTARSYVGGKQEAFTREARWKERGLTLATMVYPDKPGKHAPAVLAEHFNTSLKELGADCVDIFYLHAADRSIPFAETLEAVNKLHKEGKFVQLGLSNFTAFEVAELIPACKKYGLDVVVYNPIAGGLFSGKYKSKDIPSEGGYSDAVGRMGEMYRKRYFKDSTFDALKIIEPVAEKHGLTMVETALRWVVNHSALNVKDGNDGVIIGVSSLAQLDQNLKDCEKGPLPEEVLQALDKAWKVSQPDTPHYWHLDLKYTYDTRKALLSK